ncbi:MAG TPA: hypothetical protein VH280_15215 [Verrucomicrobiae bacterium]|nr:hypothetical protein [Verrucomicrobiae bacterium]
MMAAATILTPGYMRWPKQFDPNALSVLPILPYAVAALAILKKPRMTPVHLMALVAVTLAFMSLNWTTAWVCGPCVFFLLAMSGLNRRGLITLIAAMVVAVPLVVLLSFSAKYGHHAQGAIGIAPGKPSSGILGVIAGYTWGSGGYGEGQSTGRLFLRLAFTNIVGLFPIWLIFIYALARQIHAGVRLSWLVFAPLALTVANLVIMRNYFCHHPWMAGPVLVIGVIFSLAILRTSSAENATDALGKIPYSVVHPVALLCVIYGFAVLAFLRANETEQLALVKLVREHTARSDTIVILKGDSSTAGLAERLDDPLDRHLVVVDNLNDLANQDHCIILSSVAFDNSPRLIAKSEASSDSWLTQVADWFNRSISHRQPGDRMELRDSYYLYAAGR